MSAIPPDSPPLPAPTMQPEPVPAQPRQTRFTLTHVHTAGWALLAVVVIAAVAYGVFLTDPFGIVSGYPADRDSPTNVDHLTFWRNDSLYALTYTPVGDETVVTITPLTRSGSTDWVVVPQFAGNGVIAPSPREPVAYHGGRDGVYERFEIRVERNGATDVQYFDYPLRFDRRRV